MNHLWIIDVSLVASYRTSKTQDIKTSKYGQPDCVIAIQPWTATSPSASLQHLPIIISNRGLLYDPLGVGLRTLGLSHRDFMDLCLLTNIGSLKCYDLYKHGTGNG